MRVTTLVYSKDTLMWKEQRKVRIRTVQMDNCQRESWSENWPNREWEKRFIWCVKA